MKVTQSSLWRQHSLLPTRPREQPLYFKEKASQIISSVNLKRFYFLINNMNIKKDFTMVSFWFLLLMVVITYARFAYWEIMKPDIDNSELVAQLIFNPTYDNIPITTVSTPPITVTVQQLDTTWGERVTDADNRKFNGDKQQSFRTTQTEDEHIQQWNGSMYAIDLVSSDWNAYLPKSHKEYIITHIGQDERIADYVIIRNGTERWVYGHTVTSRSKGVLINVEKDGSILGQSNVSGISTALHSHIELWRCPEKESKMKDCNNVSSTGEVAPRNKELKEQRGWIWGSEEKREESERESTPVGKEAPFNLDKLALAVSCHETKCGTKGSAVSHNNAFWIMTWDKNGKRSFKRYEKIEDSYTDFKRIWSSYYGGFPTLKQAKRYSGNDRSEIWLNNVKHFYNK